MRLANHEEQREQQHVRGRRRGDRAHAAGEHAGEDDQARQQREAEEPQPLALAELPGALLASAFFLLQPALSNAQAHNAQTQKVRPFTMLPILSTKKNEQLHSELLVRR